MCIYTSGKYSILNNFAINCASILSFFLCLLANAFNSLEFAKCTFSAYLSAISTKKYQLYVDSTTISKGLGIVLKNSSNISISLFTFSEIIFYFRYLLHKTIFGLCVNMHLLNTSFPFFLHPF